MNKTQYILTFTLLLLVTGASAVAPFVNFLSTPKITDAYLSLDKVYIGDDLEIFIALEDSAGIKEIRAKIAHERGTDFVDFSLVSGNEQEGVWKGTWKVHDTVIDKTYEVSAEIMSKNNAKIYTVLPFVDPVVSHTPDQITPQGAGSGLDADKVDALHAAALGGGGGSGGGSLTLWGYKPFVEGGLPLAGEGSPVCPSGYVEAYSGFAWIPLYTPGATIDQAVGEMHCNWASGYLLGPVISANFLASGTSNSGIPTYSTYSKHGGAGSVTGTITCRVCAASSSAGKVATDTTVIYWTANRYKGNLGGRSGADTICTSGLPAGLNGKVTDIKAFISVAANDEIRDLHNGDSDADTVVGPFESDAPIYVFDRDWGKYKRIASDWQDLLDGTISSPISVSPNVPANEYWTGSTHYGQFQAGACNGWTATTADAWTGTDTLSNSGWLLDNNRNCNTNELPILCAAKFI